MFQQKQIVGRNRWNRLFGSRFYVLVLVALLPLILTTWADVPASPLVQPVAAHPLLHQIAYDNDVPSLHHASPFQLLSDDNNFFLKIDLHDPRVQPWVMLPHSDSGGLEPLYKMAESLGEYSEWAIINADFFSPNCGDGVNCAEGITYIRGQQKGKWHAYDTVYTIRGNIGFDQWNSVEINVHEAQTLRYMTIGGGPRVVIDGGDPTCYGEVRGNKTFFPASGEWFDDDATWWCSDTRAMSMIGYSEDRRYLYMGMSLGGQTVVQTAQWLKDRGAYNVLRLDSGGSSKMYVNGAYIHGYGSVTERPIANAFAIIADYDTPMFISPSNGETVLTDTVTFRWKNFGFDPPDFTLQVRETRDMFADAPTIVYEHVYGTEYTITFPPEWYNKDLYWSVVANVPNEQWARPHHLRVVPDGW
jgi:hypothetical protein